MIPFPLDGPHIFSTAGDVKTLIGDMSVMERGIYGALVELDIGDQGTRLDRYPYQPRINNTNYALMWCAQNRFAQHENCDSVVALISHHTC